MSNWREFERRDALLNRSEEEFSQAEIDLLQSVAEAYLRVLVADETVHQFKAESEALKKQWQEAEALYERSLIPVTQLLETQTRYESVLADFIQAEGDAAIAREELAAFLGFRNFALMPMGAEVALHPRPVSMEQATQFAIKSSPAIAAAKEGAIAAKAAVEREKGSWWPEVDLVFNQQYSDVGFDNLSSPPRTSDSVSIAVNYPLIQGGSGSARIRGAWAEYYGAQQELEAARRSVETQTRSAWLRFESANKRVLATQRAVDSAEVNVDASKRSVKAGSARVTDVLLALSQRTRAKREHSFAQFQRASAWLALELISGSDVQATASALSDALLTHAPVSAGAYTP
jgi:outer membrane protein